MRLIVAGLCLCAIGLGTGCREPSGILRLATTTSVDNSGLLNALTPAFEAKNGVDVQVLAVGSGQALKLVERGDADVAITHDPAAEATALAAGYITTYRKIIFNDFIVVGPPSDPAGLRSASDIGDAMRRIAATGAPFASRADSSGTHTKEQELWRLAGVLPAGRHLVDTGQGMAATLRIASERAAYCLTDRATFLQLSPRLSMAVAFEGSPQLLNTYAVSRRTNLTNDKARLAASFTSWLTDGEGRAGLEQFRVNGHAVFFPWPAGAPRNQPADLPHGR